jgi:hypothetical protein
MGNILIANKNNDYILTEFYYPAISKGDGNNTRLIRSLRSQTNILEDKLKKIQKVRKINAIQRLIRSNSINFILKKKDVNQLYNLSDASIIDLFFDKYYPPELFLLAKQSMDEPENDFFLHTKDMYLDSHKEKTLKLLKTKDYISLNYMYDGIKIIQNLNEYFQKEKGEEVKKEEGLIVEKIEEIKKEERLILEKIEEIKKEERLILEKIEEIKKEEKLTETIKKPDLEKELENLEEKLKEIIRKRKLLIKDKVVIQKKIQKIERLKRPTTSFEDDSREYDYDDYEFFLLRSMKSCSIKRKTKSIELDCKKYPLKIINQNIEINFYY